MPKLLTLTPRNPLVGTWGALDDDGTSAEYTISLTASGISVSARDTYDGGTGRISQVDYTNGVLTFAVNWPSGRTCYCKVLPATENQVQFEFTYTEREHLRRKNST